MAAPRQLFRGTTYLVTRRCTQRKLLLIPSRARNQVLLYCMIHASNLYNIQIHAYAFLSNHYHMVLTDPLCNLPHFQGWLNKFSAKCLNAMHGRWENLWATGSYSAVRLREELPDIPPDPYSEDILDKIVYTLTNPVAAGLVDRGYKWPGLWSPPSLMSSGYIEAKRPDFFRYNGDLPEKVRTKLTPPPGFTQTPEEITNLVLGKVREKEEEIQEAFKAQGRSFMGEKRIIAQKPEFVPTNLEPRRELNPRVACKDKWKRIEILQRLKEFLKEYRAAFTRFCNGESDVPFPPGTYKMRKLYNVKLRPRLQTEPIPI